MKLCPARGCISNLHRNFLHIESLRKAISENVPCLSHPFIGVGKRVRICGGALDGVQGTLMLQGGDRGLVVSVELLQRSVAIGVEGYDIELVC